ncbi:hypothetical protein KDW98_28275 [Burkholderia vietnamiensis]|uniref:hypothetical protein n=1 Tax=Burkholderia vietnamiensis TaxID=60552 RepID=UPI001B99BA80|nr:hypothetical protein [Burkholderia vietnamiensis]MBR8165043.1 hypothetical protein [Burkholderia vietnamiensis]
MADTRLLQQIYLELRAACDLAGETAIALAEAEKISAGLRDEFAKRQQRIRDLTEEFRLAYAAETTAAPMGE